jgi:2',3'-cyclic-nucleotide 2'-phosphodiesterase / 3'-nucleotidase / 5'-nucleotidase
MKRYRSVWITVLAALGSACGEQPIATEVDGELGTLAAALTLPDGFTIDQLSYTIAQSAMATRSGVVSVADSSRLAFRVGNLPVGGGYQLALAAVARGASGATVSCVGNQSFAVADTSVTSVNVTLTCGGGTTVETDTGGDLQVNAGVTLSDGTVCPVVTGVSILPREANVGGEMALTGFTSSSVPSAELSWSAPTGTLSAATGTSSSFTCTAPGEAIPLTLALRPADARCPRSSQIAMVTCSGAPAPADGAGTLTLLHNNDGESTLLPLTNTAGSTPLPVAGIAAYKTVTDRQIAEARAAGHAVLNVYAGDAFLASATLSCSLPPNAPTTPVYDALAQSQIAYDAHVFGNHEFDFGPDFLERFVRTFRSAGQLSQPFLSANLDFSAEAGFTDITDADGLVADEVSDSRVVARAMIAVDDVTGSRFGIVGATTPTLPTISSPRGVTVTPDLPATAAAVQREVDRLLGIGVRKIVFVSHLQDVANDRALLGLLRGIDVAVAGGGDELLTNLSVPDSVELLPGELAPRAGDYPLQVPDADGRTVYVVTTAGNYKYVGRLDVSFDAAGEVTGFDAAASYPRRVIPTSAAATTLGLSDAVPPDPAIETTVIAPVSACLADLAAPIISSEVLLDTSRAGSRGRETNVGNLVTDAFLAAYDRNAPAMGLPARGPANRVIAVQNGGGIRQNAGDVLPTTGLVPGTISRANTRNVLAFDNFMTVVSEVSPADLKAIFERSVSALGGGQFLQVAGVRVEARVDLTAQVLSTAGAVTTVGSRVQNVTLDDGTQIVANGAVVSGAPNVRLVTNSFTAAGGDNFPWLAANPNKLQMFGSGGVAPTYETVWVEYLLSLPVDALGLPTVQAENPAYAPSGEGRIRFLTP